MKEMIIVCTLLLFLTITFLSGCATTGSSEKKYRTQVIHYDEKYHDFRIKVRPRKGEHFGSKLWQLDNGPWNKFSGSTFRLHNRRDGNHLIRVEISYLDFNNLIVRKDTIEIPVYMLTSKYDGDLTSVITATAEIPVDTVNPVSRLLALGFRCCKDGLDVGDDFTIRYNRSSQQFKVNRSSYFQRRGEKMGDMFWQLDNGKLRPIRKDRFTVKNYRDGNHILRVWINKVDKTGIVVRRELIQINLYMATGKWDRWWLPD